MHGKRNAHYLCSAHSPTELLLLYFEAISDLKDYDVSKLNINNSSNSSSSSDSNSASVPTKRFSCGEAASGDIVFARNTNTLTDISNRKNLFHKFFLYCFLDIIKINDDLIKFIYNENLFN